MLEAFPTIILPTKTLVRFRIRTKEWRHSKNEYNKTKQSIICSAEIHLHFARHYLPQSKLPQKTFFLTGKCLYRFNDGLSWNGFDYTGTNTTKMTFWKIPKNSDQQWKFAWANAEITFNRNVIVAERCHWSNKLISRFSCVSEAPFPCFN